MKEIQEIVYRELIPHQFIDFMMTARIQFKEIFYDYFYSHKIDGKYIDDYFSGHDVTVGFFCFTPPRHDIFRRIKASEEFSICFDATASIDDHDNMCTVSASESKKITFKTGPSGHDFDEHCNKFYKEFASEGARQMVDDLKKRVISFVQS